MMTMSLTLVTLKLTWPLRVTWTVIVLQENFSLSVASMESLTFHHAMLDVHDFIVISHRTRNSWYKDSSWFYFIFNMLLKKLYIFFNITFLVKKFVIPSPTKLRRDIVTLTSVLPSVRNILVNTLESTSFNGFWPNLVHT